MPERGGRIMALVRAQVALGPRAPGLPGHAALRAALHRRLRRWADEVRVQRFTVRLPCGEVACENLAGTFRAAGPPGGRSSGGLLLGTHFDTRLRADRDADPEARERPIPGANDGGSGTAVLLDLLPDLARAGRAGRLRREVCVVFFDAEDVGEIGGPAFGLPFAYGARLFARQLPVRAPAEVVVLDMVGGKRLLLDVDAHALHHRESWELTARLFRLGAGLPGGAFAAGAGLRPAAHKLRYIVSDQLPFLEAGIPSCLLIDLDYPQWHTQADLPQAMDPAGLATVAEVLLRYAAAPEG